MAEECVVRKLVTGNTCSRNKEFLLYTKDKKSYGVDRPLIDCIAVSKIFKERMY